jgi:hypothetical protein
MLRAKAFLSTFCCQRDMLGTPAAITPCIVKVTVAFDNCQNLPVGFTELLVVLERVVTVGV